MSKMIPEEACTRSKLTLHEVIRSAGGAPHSPRFVPEPDWCRQEKELGGVGELLKLYSRFPVTSPCKKQTINDKPMSTTPLSIDNALAKKNSCHTANAPPGLLLPCRLDTKAKPQAWSTPPRSKMVIPEPEPSPTSSDTDQEACSAQLPTSTKLHVSAPQFPRTVRPPGVLLPAGLSVNLKREASLSPRSQSFSPEPEPAPSVDGMQARDLAAPAPAQLQVPADHLLAALKQLAATNRSLCRQPEFEQIIQGTTIDEQGDPKIRRARELASAGRGLSGYATVMMQQVPFKYTQSKLMNEMNAGGFEGTYDFFYLPANARNHGNRGFGFINFLSGDIAERFYSKFHGQKLKNHEASLPLAVIPADVQGFEESAACFFSSWQLRKKKRHSVPVFLRPVPAHL